MSVTPTHISSFSQWCNPYASVRATGNGITNPNSITLPAANVAVYYPFYLPWAYPVARAFWVNGTAVASNVDVAIYSDSLALIYATGSTAQSGASVPQYVDSADFTLSPGAYYMGLTCSGTTNALWGYVTGITATYMRSLGAFQSAHAPGAFPATLTPVQNAQASFPVFGITRMASGF